MSFLQPALLYGLPLVALPVIIHLIHRQQHKTVQWAAMLFLLDARRMTKGMAKLRQWLVLFMRTLVLLGLIFVLSRPVAGLWLGSLAGSSTDTTIILLDRSASMEQRSPEARVSKRQTALEKLTDLLDNTNPATKVLFIDSAGLLPVEVPSPQSLANLTEAGPTSTAASIPELLELAMDHIEVNETGQTDIWICSDLQKSNWLPSSPRWESIRTRATAQKALRIFLLAYPGAPADDLSVMVSGARLYKTNNQSQVLLDATITRNNASSRPLSIPVQILANGKLSVHNIEIESDQYGIQALPVPLGEETEAGWGRVQLPPDDNPRNNDAYFLVSAAPTRKTVSVSANPAFNRLVQIAAASPPDPYLTYSIDLLTPAQANQIDWDTTALLCWQAPLPNGILAQQITNFVANGGSVLFFPPENPDPVSQLFGIRWTAWDDGLDSLDPIRTWRTDSGILQNSRDGKALPLGKLKVFRNCRFEGDSTSIATLESGASLLSRAPTPKGNAWFCGTLPQPTHSSLSQDGIAFYILLHRALSQGAQKLGDAHVYSTGKNAPSAGYEWKAMGVDPPPESTRHFHAGAYNSGDQWIAYNRPPEEDISGILPDDTLASLTEGLPWQKIEDEAGSGQSITSEVWRIFLYLMAAAAILEALLCIPKRQNAPSGAQGAFPAR
jgi:hypothetical protein